jgi:hypothetical protein
MLFFKKIGSIGDFKDPEQLMGNRSVSAKPEDNLRISCHLPVPHIFHGEEGNTQDGSG